MLTENCCLCFSHFRIINNISATHFLLKIQSKCCSHISSLFIHNSHILHLSALFHSTSTSILSIKTLIMTFFINLNNKFNEFQNNYQIFKHFNHSFSTHFFYTSTVFVEIFSFHLMTKEELKTYDEKREKK